MVLLLIPRKPGHVSCQNLSVASNSVAGAGCGTLATWPAAHGFYCSWERRGTVAGKSGGADVVMDPGGLTACKHSLSAPKQAHVSIFSFSLVQLKFWAF